MSFLLGIPEIVESIQKLQLTVNQLVEATPEKKTEEKMPFGDILENKTVKGFIEKLGQWLSGETSESSVDKKLMNESLKIYNELQKKRAAALDMITDNLTKGGRIVTDQQGNIVVLKGTEEEAKKE